MPHIPRNLKNFLSVLKEGKNVTSGNFENLMNLLCVEAASSRISCI